MTKYPNSESSVNKKWLIEEKWTKLKFYKFIWSLFFVLGIWRLGSNLISRSKEGRTWPVSASHSLIKIKKTNKSVYNYEKVKNIISKYSYFDIYTVRLYKNSGYGHLDSLDAKNRLFYKPHQFSNSASAIT